VGTRFNRSPRHVDQHIAKSVPDRLTRIPETLYFKHAAQVVGHCRGVSNPAFPKSRIPK
jgi:hypothetical protein